MSSLNKIRILENDEQKKTNPNSNEAFELGFVDSLKGRLLDDLYFMCARHGVISRVKVPSHEGRSSG